MVRPPFAHLARPSGSDPKAWPVLRRYEYKFPGVCFRGVRSEDLVELRRLDDILFPVKYSSSFYHRLISDEYLTILAFEENTGRLLAASTARTETISDCFASCEGYISTLGVLPSFRRKGLGSFLLRKMVELLILSRPCVSIKLHVKADNAAAVKMYKNEGFRLIEHLPEHYTINGKKEDALLLGLTVRSRGRTDKSRVGGAGLTAGGGHLAGICTIL